MLPRRLRKFRLRAMTEVVTRSTDCAILQEPTLLVAALTVRRIAVSVRIYTVPHRHFVLSAVVCSSLPSWMKVKVEEAVKDMGQYHSMHKLLNVGSGRGSIARPIYVILNGLLSIRTNAQVVRGIHIPYYHRAGWRADMLLNKRKQGGEQFAFRAY
eukprot:3020629-Pleurochrysis_carterae.AAC.3